MPHDEWCQGRFKVRWTLKRARRPQMRWKGEVRNGTRGRGQIGTNHGTSKGMKRKDINGTNMALGTNGSLIYEVS